MSRAAQVARVVARMGGGAVARGWRIARRAPGRALVLMYHRVSPEPDYQGMTVAPADFARQLEVLQRRARVVPLAALVARLADPAPLAGDQAAITFDDGYRDNLDAALPILTAAGLPATVFVSTGFVDGTAHPAGERLRHACELLWREHTPASAWAGETPLDALVRRAIGTPRDWQTVGQLRQALKRVPGDGAAVLAALERLAGGVEPRRDLMLDWHAVRTLAAAGIEIGSHAVTHEILSHLGPAQADDEIVVSKKRLESELGRPVTGFAFPNGGRDDFLPEHLASLRRAGYAYACSAVTGSNHPGADAFQLRRIGVGADSRELLDLKLALGRAA